MSLKTISQAAKEIGVAQHVLRFWEQEFPSINPLKRNGRRLYSTEDIVLLKRVRELLYNKRYTIEGVKKELKVRKQEMTYKECLEESLLHLQEIYDKLSEKYGV